MIYTACAAMKCNALCALMICQALSAWIKKEQLYSCSFLVRVRGRIFALQICPARRQNGQVVSPPAHRPPAKYAKGHVSLNGERLLKVQVLYLFHTKKESISLCDILSFLVRVRGLEPPRSCPHQNLNLARLPIPPYPHIILLTYEHIIASHLRFVKCFFNIEKNLFLSCFC